MYRRQKLGLAHDAAKAVYSLTLQLRDDLSKSPDPQPDGAEVKKFCAGFDG